ncbi:HET-domain-containing protein [Apiospora arundinis]
MDTTPKSLSRIYATLPRPDSIRLLELEPAANNQEPLRGSLVVTTLEEIISDVTMGYTALSYAWGNPAQAGSIVLRGCDVGITANLARALTDIRHTSRVTFIWADALCINQQDNDERSRQVRIMGDIYRRAASTIIYLGPLMPNSLCLFRHIAAMNLKHLQLQSLNRSQRHIIQPLLPNAPLPSNPDSSSGLGPLFEGGSLASCGSELDSEQLALAIDEVCSSEWFTRAWVFQELVLSVDPRIQCGRMLARWSDVADVVEANTKTDRKQTPTAEELKIDVFLEMNKASNGKGRNTLSNLIRARAGARVTDPRDFFYCLMGIADDRQEWEGVIQMDYSVSARSLYTLVAREMFYRGETSLKNLLAQIAAKQESPAIDRLATSSLLPSWVYDWEILAPPGVRRPSE